MLVAFGISALITASPTAFLILKTGGAAYLLWLAVQAIRFGSKLTVAKVEEQKGTPLSNISSGFWVNLLNPKVIIFFMTFLPQFVSAGDPAVTQKLLFFGFCFILIGMPVNASVVFAADWLASGCRTTRKCCAAWTIPSPASSRSSLRRSCSPGEIARGRLIDPPAVG